MASSIRKTLGAKYDEGSDRLPKLDDTSNSVLWNQDMLLECAEQTEFEGHESGLTYKSVFVIKECEVPGFVGKKVVHMIGGLDGKWASMKQDKLRNLHAAIFNKDANSPQKWGEIAEYCVEKQAANGKLVRAAVGEKTKAKRSENYYVPVSFRPA